MSVFRVFQLRTHLVDAISSKEVVDKIAMTVLYAMDGHDGLVSAVLGRIREHA